MKAILAKIGQFLIFIFLTIHLLLELSRSKWFLNVSEATKNILAFINWWLVDFDACRFFVWFLWALIGAERLHHDVRLDSIPTTDRLKNIMSETKWFLNVSEATKNILAFINWWLIDFDACEFSCDFCVIFVSLDWSWMAPAWRVFSHNLTHRHHDKHYQPTDQKMQNIFQLKFKVLLS